MASDRISTLQKKLERGLAKSLQFFKSLDGDQWDSPVSGKPDAWSVRQILWHFIYSEEYLLKTAQDIAEGGPGVLDKTEIDLFNLQEMGKIPALSNEDLLESLAENRRMSIKWVGTLDDTTLDLEGGHPTLGPSNVETLIFSIYAHQLLHMRELVPYLKP